MNRRETRETKMILNARLRLGLSQQQVATLIGIQIRQYQRFEYGETEIQRINIRAGLALCAVLELNPVELVFEGRKNALTALIRQRPTKGNAQIRRKNQASKPGKPRKNDKFFTDDAQTLRDLERYGYITLPPLCPTEDAD